MIVLKPNNSVARGAHPPADVARHPGGRRFEHGVGDLSVSLEEGEEWRSEDDREAETETVREWRSEDDKSLQEAMQKFRV